MTSQNKKVGTVELSDRIFGAKWNVALVRQIVVAQLANARKPVAHTKDRSEVSGGGKKPWAQKHTGKARHGSSRSPLWVGGGITFGPRNDRDFSQKVNKKMKAGALWSVLSKKLAENEIVFVDELKLAERKTQLMVKVLAHFSKKNESTLIIPASANKAIFTAARNIEGVDVVDAGSLSVYDCLSHRRILIEKNALDTIQK